MKKNNNVQKNLIDAEQIMSALQEGTQKKLQQVLAEALNDVISLDDKDEDDVEDTIEDDSYEVEDVKTDEKSTDDAPEKKEKESEEEGSEADEDETSDEKDDEEESDINLDDYKVGDNDYDLTGVDDETAFKIYSKMGDSDLIHIKKTDDNTYEIKDDNSGADLVLDFNLDSEDGEEEKDEDEFEIEMDDEEPSKEEDEFELELDDEEPSEDDDELEVELDDEDDSDEDDEIEIDMNDFDDEDEDKKECKDGECDIDEAATTVSQQPTRKATMSQTKQHRPNNPILGAKVDYPLDEATKAKVKDMLKPIVAENKQYQKVLEKLNESMQQALLTNRKYGMVLNLFMNESTTKEEKENIVKRFDNAKTLEESKILFESIKREMGKSANGTPKKLDEQISLKPTNTINETKIYQNPEIQASMSLMERMDKIFGKKSSKKA